MVLATIQKSKTRARLRLQTGLIGHGLALDYARVIGSDDQAWSTGTLERSWIHLGELGMYIINPKSIIYMDPTRPGQLGRPGPRANLVYITLFVFVIYMDPPWGAGDVCYNLQTYSTHGSN